MNKYVILCVDDEREILDSIVKDIDPLYELFDIEATESVSEAREVIAEMPKQKQQLALILCDHVMPGELGVDFLIELNKNPATRSAKKLLLTGQAGLENTIEAINHGNLDYYIAKPWQAKNVYQVVVNQLTNFIIENEDDLIKYAKMLDQVRIFEVIHKKGTY